MAAFGMGFLFLFSQSASVSRPLAETASSKKQSEVAHFIWTLNGLSNPASFLRIFRKSKS
jgi:hypothetical protein